jgi:uncharacterized repeat protein (TIGR03803 family)
MVWHRRLAAVSAFISCAPHMQAPAEAAMRQVSVLHVFNGRDGAGPAGGLIQDAAGNLYGATSAGGQFNQGTVFRVSPPAPGRSNWTETVLHSFNANTGDGARPGGRLVQDPAGNLYGVTKSGGPFLFGTVFRLSPVPGSAGQWSETLLHGFGQTNQDGSVPVGGLVMDASGHLFGLTFEGGIANRGIAFELTPPASGSMDWAETILHSFRGHDGEAPVGALVLSGDGRLYGVTSSGGDFGDGTLFQLAQGPLEWVHKSLFEFSLANGTGASPLDGLAFGPAGALIGTTSAGGPYGNGTVFEISPSIFAQGQWTYTLVAAFQSQSADGAFPQSGVAVSPSGDIFGTAPVGGRFHGGTLFKMAPTNFADGTWNETVLQAFGRRPPGPPGLSTRLLLDDAGHLYGTTFQGGRGYGSVFKAEQ